MAVVSISSMDYNCPSICSPPEPPAGTDEPKAIEPDRAPVAQPEPQRAPKASPETPSSGAMHGQEQHVQLAPLVITLIAKDAP